jgi:lipid II:glycine glycyltransferase (peptidoglycan interpeptide bridge formation enzyme)
MFTEFSGPIFLPSLNVQAIQKLMAELHEFVAKDKSYIEFGCKGEQTWAGMLNVHGYKNLKRATLIVDLLSGEQAVWSSFEGRARNMVRKAEKAGVVVHTVVPDNQWIGQYYLMLVNTFRRQGLVAPHPHSFYKQLIELSNTNIARCVMAEVNGVMIAGGIFLIDQKRMLYLSGASTEEGMNLAATSLLQWHAIKEAIQLGVTEYDMGGLGVPSIDKFKRSFGGKDFIHNRWVFSSKLFKIIEPIARLAIKKGWFRIGG